MTENIKTTCDETEKRINNTLRDFTDRLESLHNRMDKFYVWAGVLQKEYRAMQQRVAFLESQCELDVGQAALDACLQERLLRAKSGEAVVHRPP